MEPATVYLSSSFGICKVLNKAFEAFDKHDFHQFFSYYNEYQIPYESRIYPKKDEPDKEVIQELDNWAQENKLDKMNDLNSSAKTTAEY